MKVDHASDLNRSLNSVYPSIPHPFNPTTTIEFTLAEDNKVSLFIYDLLGHEVAALVIGELKAEALQQVTFDASKPSSGIYFYRVESGSKSLVKKLVVMK